MSRDVFLKWQRNVFLLSTQSCIADIVDKICLSQVLLSGLGAVDS